MENLGLTFNFKNVKYVFRTLTSRINESLSKALAYI